MIKISFIISVAIVAFGFATTPRSALAQDSKTDSNKVTAGQCDQLLEKSVIDFYMPNSIDNKNLGFHEAIDETGKFVPGNKFLVLQARQTWFFSHLAVNQTEPKYRMHAGAAAELGYFGLQKHFRDKDRGGYILITDPEGKAVDDRKHVYPMCFVIYALVEMHRITDSPQPLDDAMKLFREIEKHCYDKEHGGYQELFANNWKLIDDPEQWGVVSTAGIKTYNSHLHIMEAFTELYRETKDELVGKRLEELIAINTKTVRHPEFPCLSLIHI